MNGRRPTMVNVAVVLAAAVAVVLAAGVAEAAGSTAEALRHRHHRRHHRHADADAERDEGEAAAGFMPPPPPGMFGALPPVRAANGDMVPPPPSAAEAFRFMQAAAGAGAEDGAEPTFQDILKNGDAGADIVKSIYNLLSTKRDNNVAETTRVMSQMVETKKKQQELEEAQNELKKKAAMLLRLQYCLEQDQLSQQQQQQKAAAASAGGAASGGASSDSSSSGSTSTALTVEEAKKRTDELVNAEKALAERTAKVAQREKEAEEREAAIAKRMADVKRQDDALTKRAQDSNSQRAAVQQPPSGQLAAAVCPGACAANKDCSSCAANAGCGWCRSSQQCQEVVQPGNQPTNCPVADWNHMFCAAEACEDHRDCRSCLADPECGFCSTTGKCTKGALSGPTEGTCHTWNYAAGHPMTVLSMNVYGRDTTNTTGRAPTIFKMIREANADLVLLQEVEDWLLDSLSREPWAKAYHSSDFGSGHAPGGLLILSKVPLGSVAYYEKTQPGQVEVDQRGRLLVVHPKLGSENFAVATTTLDWRSGENRADSLDFIASVLNNTGEVLFAGDLNFDAGSEPETSHLPKSFQDVWSTLRPKQPGFTWDPTTNTYARQSDPHSRPSRIDRMFVANGFNKLVKIDKIGCNEASPHYALLAKMEMYGAFC